MITQRLFALKLVPAVLLMLAAAQAHAVAQEPEQLASVGPVGLAIFGVLFIGFCVGVVWMMARQKDPGNEQEKK
jgi:hypothetical protein